MEYWVIFLVVTLGIVNSCPYNCICEEEESTCTLRSCSDEISLEYTDFLIIQGKLCANHRKFLSELTPNTIVVLKNDYCENVRNCRQDYINEQGQEAIDTITLPNAGKDIFPIPFPVNPNVEDPVGDQLNYDDEQGLMPEQVEEEGMDLTEQFQQQISQQIQLPPLQIPQLIPQLITLLS